MPRQSLELVPDQPSRDAVRAIWTTLADGGLPSQADHRGQSNEVHLTLLEADDLRGVLERAAATVVPMLPLTLPVTGTVVLGVAAKSSLAVALTVEVPQPLRATIDDLRESVPVSGRPWLPHVTLARRLDEAAAARVQAAVDGIPESLAFTELRHWDPATRTLQRLA